MTAKNSSSSKSADATATLSWLSVVRAYNLCDVVMTQRLAVLGLRLGEHEVLVNLLRAPGITQQQLAERCYAAKSGVSMLVTKMEKSGLLQRRADAVDARIRRLFLTAKGQALAGQAQQIQTTVVAAMVGHSTKAELNTITEAMQRASGTLERMLRADG